MNVATYVYIVHSDINENNIYAEFATEEEAIDYARRHKDELTYVDKVDAALDKDGEILEIFDERTIWVYDEEDEEKDEEEINEFDTDFEDEESEGWSVCVVTPDDGDSDWEHFDSESEARDYFDNYTSYESGREVEVQLYGPDGMEDSYTIGADEDLDESLLEKITISEGIKLRTREEQDEFFRLCDEIGIYTAKDLINFKKEVGCTDENILQALRDYRAELGPDFKIANPELERELAMKYEGIDFDKLVEELEEFEDEVECRECYGLFPKESCIKGEHGYVCEKCSKTLTESISELTPEQLAEMDAYLRSGKDLSLDDFEEEHADFAIDVVSGELSFNEDTNTFDFRLSIYHASEDNNAEYADYHTDEEDYNFDSIEEVYDEFPQYLIDIYKWNFVKTEAIKMTRDELMNKEGTDDVELINAGRPEEERVELIEDGLDPHTVIARVERWLENKDRPLYIFNGPKTLEEITNYLESKEISYRVVDAKDGYVESNGDIIIYVANESRQYIPELWEDPAIMLTPTYGHNVVSAYDFNTKESCWALDQLVRKMFKKFNGISADALRQLHKTYKHMSNTALGKTFADCETLSDVVDKLDPYFDFAMTKSLYHRDVESYDKIINDLPDAIWEVLNK